VGVLLGPCDADNNEAGLEKLYRMLLRIFLKMIQTMKINLFVFILFTFFQKNPTFADLGTKGK